MGRERVAGPLDHPLEERQALLGIDEPKRRVRRWSSGCADSLKNVNRRQVLMAVRNRMAHSQPLVQLRVYICRADRDRTQSPPAPLGPGPVRARIETDALEQFPRVLSVGCREAADLRLHPSGDHSVRRQEAIAGGRLGVGEASQRHVLNSCLPGRDGDHNDGTVDRHLFGASPTPARAGASVNGHQIVGMPDRAPEVCRSLFKVHRAIMPHASVGAGPAAAATTIEAGAGSACGGPVRPRTGGAGQPRLYRRAVVLCCLPRADQFSCTTHPRSSSATDVPAPSGRSASQTRRRRYAPRTMNAAQ